MLVVVLVVVVVHLGVIITGPVVYSHSQVEWLSVPAQSGPACCQHHRHSQFSVLSSQYLTESQNKISVSSDTL